MSNTIEPSNAIDRRRLAALSLAIFAATQLGLAACRDSAPDDLVETEETTEAVVFLKTTGEETLNRSWASGNLYKLSPIAPDGVVTPITAFTGAAISDPCVSFDGTRILFSMRAPGESNRNIWEIRADGTGLTRITDGGGHDFDPLYLPDGRILFTSSRHREMDEYNHALTENLYRCNADGSDVHRISFNQSDDFDPTLLPDGRVMYTRWDHFGTFNRFPLFFTHPDGSSTFHMFGPHQRNFFHAQPTPDGRLIAIESTMVNEDAGPIAVLKLEAGPADPATGGNDQYWNVLTEDVNTSGAPWTYGAFKYPFPLGGNTYVVSYTLPAATEEDVDYALYTLDVDQEGAGTDADPATISLNNLTFLYNDPNTNEYDAQLLAAHPKPPVIEDVVDEGVDWGIFTAADVFNRGTQDGQARPVRGIDPIDRIAVIAARPTLQGEANTYSANEFEKRALIGFAPVQSDGSFRIRVPADTPVSWATLDEHDRGLVVKRTHVYVRPGEEFDRCFGCHEDRAGGGPLITNPDPIAATLEPTDLNLPPDEWTVINFENDIAPIVYGNCMSCHVPTYAERDSLVLPDSVYVTVVDTIPPPGNLELSDRPDTLMEMNQIFPVGYVNLSGEAEDMDHDVVVPAFPRRSRLIDYVLGLGVRDGNPHPENEYALTDEQKSLFNYWVLLGAQYK
jgi:hypothetical protein